MSQSVIGALRVNLGLDSAQFTKGLTAARQRLRQVGAQMQRVGAAVSVVGAGIALAVRGQVNAFDELGKKATKLSIPVEELSRLAYAGRLSNVSMGQLEVGITALSRNMVQMPKRFEQFGIAVRDANGEVRPTTEVLGDVAEVLRQLPEGAERTAAAMLLLGKSGADLLPMLVGGRDGLQALKDEADAFGVTITGETAAAAAQFNDNLTRLNQTFTSLFTIIAADLAPVLAKMTDYLVEATAAFRDLDPRTRKIITILAGVTVVLGPLLIALGTLVTILAGISAPVLIVIAAIAGLTAAVAYFWPEIKQASEVLVDFGKRALAFVQDRLPGLSANFEIMQAAVAAVFALIRGDFDGFRENLARIPEAVRGMVDSVRAALVAFGEMIVREIKSAGANALSAARDLGKDILRGLVEGLIGEEGVLRNTVYGVMGRVVSSAKDALQSRSPSRVFMEIGSDITEGLAIGIEENSARPMGALGSLVEQMRGMAQEFASSFEGAFTSFVTGAKTAQQALADLARDLARMLAQSAIRRLFSGLGGSGGFLGSLFGGFRAEGGPVSAGRAYVVGERGPEMFVPRSSGGIVPNHKMGGGEVQIVVRIDPSGEFDARVADTSGRVAVRVVNDRVPAMIGGGMRRAREKGFI